MWKVVNNNENYFKVAREKVLYQLKISCLLLSGSEWEWKHIFLKNNFWGFFFGFFCCCNDPFQ